MPLVAALLCKIQVLGLIRLVFVLIYWFSYLDITRITARINSAILVESEALAIWSWQWC